MCYKTERRSGGTIEWMVRMRARQKEWVRETLHVSCRAWESLQLPREGSVSEGRDDGSLIRKV